MLGVHVQALLDISASAAATRLRALAAAGYLARRHVIHGHPACHLITREGLRALGHRSAPPRLDLSTYDHDVGLAWVWLAAAGGAFGELREVIGERRMRSLDASWEREGASELPRAAELPRAVQPPLGVRLGGLGAGGRPRLHYPDLTLVTRRGTRVAVELELSSKSRSRRERILAGYAADPRIEAVLYLVESPSVGRALKSSAKALGIGKLIHVQLAELTTRTQRGAGAQRTLSRPSSRPEPERVR